MRRAPLAALVIPLAACAGFKQVNIFTVPQEMAVGEIFSSQVESYYPILHDPQLDWYLNHRGRELADLSDRRDLPYVFNVVDGPELNAFAIPGGHIYLNLGMIEACENEAQLLGIVGHEIGHVIARHSMKTLSQESIVNIVGTIALNQYPNQWAALAANLFGATGFLKMSRDAEREADQIGLDLMLRAGYEPAEMTHIFEKLLKLYEKEPGLLEKLFSTHPPTRERIENLRAAIASRTMPPKLVSTTPEYGAAYDHVIATYYSEAGRRRWKQYIQEKEDKDRKKEDRLPWDKKSDEEKKKREDKEKAKRDQKRERQEQKEAGKATPSPAATPGPPADPAPSPAGPEAIPEASPAPTPAAGSGSDGAAAGGDRR